MNSRLSKLSQPLSAEQRRIAEEMNAGPRAGSAFGGPFEVWLRSPRYADAVQRFGAFMRYQTSLPPRLSELAILICARHWTAQYEWFIHAPIAESAGVSANVIGDLHAGRVPDLPDPVELALYTFATSLLANGRVDDLVYDRAVAALGEPALVELSGLLGYYTLVAFTLNAFEVEVPQAGFEPLTKPI
jgi:4-carboxymuconolactone decarboxylase